VYYLARGKKQVAHHESPVVTVPSSKMGMTPQNIEARVLAINLVSGTDRGA
jgi:hypothetical protein